MTSSIGVFADLVISLVLVAAISSPRLSRLARLLIATSASACAWLLAAALDAQRVPSWTIFAGGAVIAVSIYVMAITLHLWTQEGEAQRGLGLGGNDDEGGPRRGPPDAPRHGGDGNDPSWWPEFARQLAFYVAEPQRENRQPAVLPAEPAPRATASVHGAQDNVGACDGGMSSLGAGAVLGAVDRREHQASDPVVAS